MQEARNGLFFLDQKTGTTFELVKEHTDTFGLRLDNVEGGVRSVAAGMETLNERVEQICSFLQQGNA